MTDGDNGLGMRETAAGVRTDIDNGEGVRARVVEVGVRALGVQHDEKHDELETAPDDDVREHEVVKAILPLSPLGFLVLHVMKSAMDLLKVFF